VTGATGYVGGRLVPRLLDRDHQVRVLVRDATRIAGRPWLPFVEVVEGDLLRPDSLPPALAGIEAAFYLVHAMSAGRDFADRDRAAAEAFAAAAGHLAQVVYLGGVQPPTHSRPSQHLRSRAEVGELLRASLPVTEFRAGPVIGSGSASFEMVRYLTERLPVMGAPRWILNPVQPIAIRNVLDYLLGALDRGPLGVVDIGAEILSFREMILGYAAVRGLRRLIIPVPILAPSIAARLVGLVTPIPNALAVPLIEGVSHPLLADTRLAQRHFPEIVPMGYREAVERALERIEQQKVETRWSGALGGAERVELADREGMIREVRTIDFSAPPSAVFGAFSGLGGDRGWLTWRWAWWLRGLADGLIGGPGLRRGRRDPDTLLVGEAVDFWRVEAVDPPRLLRLRAEMKLPGSAWLQWEAIPNGAGTRLVQAALFHPTGLAGTLYWRLLYPLHRLIFSALARAVGRRADRLAAAQSRITPAT